MSSRMSTLEPLIDDLFSYDLSFLKERFMDVYPCSNAEFEEVQSEFKKFMVLVLTQNQPLAVVSEGVDELWHTFMIFSPQYHEFCNSIFGEYVHHQPHTGATPVPAEALTNFFKAYDHAFGQLAPIWHDKYPDEVIASLEAGRVPRDFTYKWSGWTGRSDG